MRERDGAGPRLSADGRQTERNVVCVGGGCRAAGRGCPDERPMGLPCHKGAPPPPTTPHRHALHRHPAAGNGAAHALLPGCFTFVGCAGRCSPQIVPPFVDLSQSSHASSLLFVANGGLGSTLGLRRTGLVKVLDYRVELRAGQVASVLTTFFAAYPALQHVCAYFEKRVCVV